ncbi:MAG: F-type H+-transporting ATPase subunit gamma, partial [Acidimicrobiaceae bacterium]
VVVTADRGLAGGYNNNVIRAAERAMRADRGQGREIKLYVIGKKANKYFRFRRVPIEETFLGVTDQPTYEQAREVAHAVAEAFNNSTVDAVQLVYTQFLSAGTQRVVQRQLMPLDTATLEDAKANEAGASYEFEPSPDLILGRLLPRYAEARLFAAFLDASASEHAARQRAMKAATDNAEELIKNLSRVMNRARQDAITTEIMEIVGGAEALRRASSDHDDLLLDHVTPDDLLGAPAP